ncbi:MAG: hypothetical protein U0V74_13880 [Chitinophagales bacterium]
MPDFIQHTFLGRVFKGDKLLFALFVLYIAGVLYGVRYSREEFPFMLYGMYSLPEAAKPNYVTYQIEIDGKVVPYTDMWDSKKELLTSPLSGYNTLSENLRNNFQQWLLRYASAGHGKSVSVYALTCQYGNDGAPQVIDKTELFTYATE